MRTDRPLPQSETDMADIPLGSLQVSLFRLMTLYTLMPCSARARTIVRLLSALIQHPDLAHEPPKQLIYLQMLDTWSQLADDTAVVRCVNHERPAGVH